MIHNFKSSDNILSENYDVYNMAIEFGDPLSEVLEWRIDRLEWAKVILKVNSNLAKSKTK